MITNHALNVERPGPGSESFSLKRIAGSEKKSKEAVPKTEVLEQPQLFWSFRYEIKTVHIRAFKKSGFNHSGAGRAYHRSAGLRKKSR
jgi:hypothetical protein